MAKQLTTAAGIPVGDNQNSITVGKQGPLLVQDWQLFEKHAHFNRERIPERVVHAKGSAAYGTLTINQALPQYTKAAFLGKAGNKRNVFCAFPPSPVSVAPPMPSAMCAVLPESVYHRGQLDMVGNNTPVFFVRDRISFPILSTLKSATPKPICAI